MKRIRPPIDPGPAGWDAILPPRRPQPALSESKTADWLVIGAGFAGLAAARRLTQLDPTGRVVVLEARRIAEGPAGRNSGFMIDLPHDLASDDYGADLERDRMQIAMNREALAFAKEVVETVGMPDEAWSETGKINGAATPKGARHNRSYAAHLTRLGEAHEILDAKAMRGLTGTDFYGEGLFTPGAVMIQPALFVRGAADTLASNRLTLHENSPVTGLERADGLWRATTERGSVAAPKAILAVNGYATRFGRFTGRLMPVFTYASMTRSLGGAELAQLGGRSRWGITPADPMGTTVRRVSGTGGDRIVVRNRFTYTPSMEVGDRALAKLALSHDRAFAARFPKLQGVEMEHRWGGMLSLSRNGTSAFGEVDEGLYAACCQNGLGTVRGTLSGKLAAELATRQEPSTSLKAMLSEAAPARLPPEWLSRIGINAVIRHRERAAGREL